MKIVIEFDGDKDRAALERIFAPVAVVAQAAPVPVVKASAHKAKFPKIHGKLAETVFQMIKHNGGVAMIHDLVNLTDYSKDSIKNGLWDLMHIGKIKSDGHKRGARYWIASDGDPELRDMFPAGTKVTVMR